MSENKPPENQTSPTEEERKVVRLRYERAVTGYANLAFVTSTPEEVVMHFGVNVMPPNPQREVNVEISNRVIMTYASAKRLALMLGNVIRRYEEAHGAIDVGPQPIPETGADLSSSGG